MKHVVVVAHETVARTLATCIVCTVCVVSLLYSTLHIAEKAKKTPIQHKRCTKCHTCAPPVTDQPWPMNSAPGPSAADPRCTLNSIPGLRSSSGSTATPGISLHTTHDSRAHRLQGQAGGAGADAQGVSDQT